MLGMATHTSPAKGSSPSENAILIQRFLARLSAYVGADEAETWRSDPRFHYNIQALHDLISATEKSGSSYEVSAELHDQIREFMAQAQEYQAALDLATVPGYVEPCQEVDDSTSTQLDTTAPDGAVLDAQAKAFSALRASGPNDRLMKAKELGGDVYNRLSAQEDIQEELTDQMVSMAAQLRSQAEAQSNALHARDVALDSAAQGLLKSVHGVTAVVSDTKTAVKRSRRSIFFIFFLLSGVAMALLGMYGFINITAATQAFVPYSTVASTWNKPRAQAPQRRQSVRPVTTHAPPAAPAAPAPSDDAVHVETPDTLEADRQGESEEEEYDEQEVDVGIQHIAHMDSDAHIPSPETLQSLEEVPLQDQEVDGAGTHDDQDPADARGGVQAEHEAQTPEEPPVEEPPAEDNYEEKGHEIEDLLDDERIEQVATDVEHPNTAPVDIDPATGHPEAADIPTGSAQEENLPEAQPEEVVLEAPTEAPGDEDESSSTQAPHTLDNSEASVEAQSADSDSELGSPTAEDSIPPEGDTLHVVENDGLSKTDSDSEPDSRNAGAHMSEKEPMLNVEAYDEGTEHDASSVHGRGEQRVSAEQLESIDGAASDSGADGDTHDEL